MTTCTIRWRSSGGRGEFEYVPADTLEDRSLNLYFEPLNLTIPTEVRGVKAQGKPRLRKLDKNNRQKLHLPQLVMSVARLPHPAREDTTHKASFPLENKSFVMNEMHFDVIDDDGITVTLAPLWVSVLHSDFHIDLQDRFQAIAADLNNISIVRAKHPALADSIQKHGNAIMAEQNTASISTATDEVLKLQAEIFGMTNASSIVKLEEALAQPETEIEEVISGQEGRLLARVHYYKERDRKFSIAAKKYYKAKNGGRLTCDVCNLDPTSFYGANGERCIEAHHKIPIEELQPDSVTRVDDMAMVCASCHRVIHSMKPCLTIEEARNLINFSKQNSG